MNKLKRILAGGAMVLVTGLVSVGGAHAALIRGAVDPNFGGSGAAGALYWTGLIQFDTNLTCLNQNGGSSLLAPPSACPGLPGYSSLLVSATLGTGPGNPPGTISINFTTPSLPTIGIFLSGGTPIGISATEGPAGPFGRTSFVFSSTVQGNAWLQFVFDDPQTGGLSHGIFTLEICNVNNPYLPTCLNTPDSRYASSSVGALVVTVVPEPPIAWLLLAALPAAWLVRRRRSQAR